MNAPLTEHSAHCRGPHLDPDLMFARGAAQHLVKRVCAPCPLRTACLAYALDHRVEFGVWGGMTEHARRKLLRRRPDVGNWARLLKRAEQRYTAHAS